MDCCGGMEDHDEDCTEVKVKDSIDQGTVEAAKALESENYSAGFVTDIEMDMAPKGLSEDTIRFISAKKEEPEWLLEWRLAAYKRWLTMEEPTWAMVNYPTINYQDYYYYAAPKSGAKYESIDDVPKEILETYESSVSRCAKLKFCSVSKARQKPQPPHAKRPALPSMRCSILSLLPRPSARSWKRPA